MLEHKPSLRWSKQRQLTRLFTSLCLKQVRDNKPTKLSDIDPKNNKSTINLFCWGLNPTNKEFKHKVVPLNR